MTEGVASIKEAADADDPFPKNKPAEGEDPGPKPGIVRSPASPEGQPSMRSSHRPISPQSLSPEDGRAMACAIQGRQTHVPNGDFAVAMASPNGAPIGRGIQALESDGRTKSRIAELRDWVDLGLGGREGEMGTGRTTSAHCADDVRRVTMEESRAVLGLVVAERR